jgi:DNA repair exonuclease SbcCD nuclease subunit
MSKVLITADLHLHNHRNESRRIDDGLACLEWIYDVASQKNVESVIIAGDLLHNRFQIGTYLYARACEVIKKHDNTFLLLGNHDMLYEDDWNLHSLVALRSFNTTPGVRIIEKPETVQFGKVSVDFLPYTSSPSKYLDKYFKKPSSLLISHLPVLDAILNARFDIRSIEDDSKNKEVLGVDAFKRWKKVLLGHYHYGQQLNEVVEYIGSPMQLSFGEAGHKKHVIILDLETLAIEYVENSFSPQFHIIEKESELDSLNVKDDYVQIRTDAEITAKFDMRNKLTAGGARWIEFVPVKKDVVAQTSDALENVANVINNKEQLIEHFVQHANIPPELDKNLLAKIGKSIVSAA